MSRHTLSLSPVLLALLILLTACAVQQTAPPTPTLQPTSPPPTVAPPTATRIPMPEPTHTPVPPTPTPEPEPRRIRFAEGATSATVFDTLQSNGVNRYILRALGDQSLIVDITAPNPVLLRVWGMDGTVLKQQVGGTTHWEGELPSTQDYVLELTSSGPETDYQMTITIPRLVEPTPALNTYRNEEYDFETQYPSNFVVEVTCYPAAVRGEAIVSFRLTGAQYYAGTNLFEACVIIGVGQDEEARSTCLEPSSYEEYLGEEEFNSISFYKGSLVEGAAGNVYEVTSYRTLHEEACFEIALFLHSGNIGMYTPGDVSEFDREEVMNRLRQVLYTFRFTE